MKRNRILALMLAAMMMITLLTGCGGSAASAPSDPAGETPAEDAKAEETAAAEATNANTELTIGYLGFYSTFNHATGLSDVSDILSDRLLFDPLFEYNDATLEMESRTLESWGWEDDNVYKMVLKKGIMFSDGTELTGDDVIASLKIMVDNGFTEIGSYSIIDFEKSYVEDTYTVRLYYNEVNAAAIKRLAVNIYNKGFLETYPDGDDIWWSGIGIVGSGPYEVTDSAMDSYVVYEKRADYWDDSVSYDADKITIKYYTDGTALVADLQNGVVDVALNLDSMMMDAVEAYNTGNLEVGKIATNDVGHIFFNNGLPETQDINVRKAVALAVDWDAVSLIAYGNCGDIATSHYATSLDCYVEHEEYAYDPDAAAEALAAAGYKPGELTLNFLASDSMQASVGEAMQEYLAAIGINLMVDSVELASAFPYFMSGEKYHIGIKVQPGGNPMFEPFDDFCLPTSMMGMAHINDAAYVDLLMRANSSRDDAERNELYAELDSWLYEEYQRIPFVEIFVGYAYNTEVVSDFHQCALGRGNLANLKLA